MKRLIRFYIALFFVAIGSCAYAQVILKNDQVTASKLKENVIHFDTKDHSSFYLIIGSERAVLIDTGTQVDSLYQLVKSITDKPFDVILTHFHGDHAGSANQFSDIWIHPADIPLLSDNLTQGKTIIHELKEGQLFDLGDKQLFILHTPGHTPGSITVLDKKSRCCYTGDSFGSGEVWLQCQPIQPIKTFYQSCKKLQRMIRKQYINEIWCGHQFYANMWSKGEPIKPEYIQTMMNLADELMRGKYKNVKPYPYPNPLIDSQTTSVLKGGHCILVFNSYILKVKH